MTATEDLPLLGSQKPRIGHMNPLMHSLQQQAPICRVRTQTGDEAWLVTRHAELKKLLMDKRVGPTHPDPPNRARYLDNPLLDLLIQNEDPEFARDRHVRMRNALTPHFSARRMAELQPRVAGRVSDLLDAVIDHGPPADMHAEMGLPLSFGVLCDLLEIPDPETYMEMLGSAAAVADPNNPSGFSHPLFGYLEQVAAVKRDHPDDGLVSYLCQAGYTDKEVSGMTAMVSISYQVTPTNISAGIALFAINTDQRDLLISDPTLREQAVEESLRMSKVSESFVPRYAAEDIEIGGVTIKVGDLILCDHYSAGFDDLVFEEPNRFDITRSPNPHLAFSRGITHCIGAPLARLEIAEVFAGIMTRLPELRLAVAPADIPMLAGQLGGGIAELPVTW
jgi:cytochrome P450 monooxygenase